MANSELYNKTYKIPSDVLKYIQTTLVSNPTGNGVKRAKFILKNGNISYQDMKRLKNFFDHFNFESDDKIQYALAGGNLMKSFIEKSLNFDRNTIKQSKKIKQDMNVDVNLGTKAYNSPNLSEETTKKFNIDNYDKLKKNAIAVIVNDDNNILLLKRADAQKIWQPNKWALVGGSVEKNEEPEEACKREIKEETNLIIDEFIERVVIQRNPDSIEHIYASRYDGDNDDITLNNEHVSYGWFDVNEIDYLDTVPNLKDYINLVFIKYD